MNIESPIPLMLFSNATVRAGAEEVVLHLLRGLDRNLFRLHLACPPPLARLLEAVSRDVELSACRWIIFPMCAAPGRWGDASGVTRSKFFIRICSAPVCSLRRLLA